MLIYNDLSLLRVIILFYTKILEAIKLESSPLMQFLVRILFSRRYSTKQAIQSRQRLMVLTPPFLRTDKQGPAKRLRCKAQMPIQVLFQKRLANFLKFQDEWELLSMFSATWWRSIAANLKICYWKMKNRSNH